MLFKIDETGTARGRLEPEGNTFLLDSPVSGEVTEIRVKQGQSVKAGQVLVVLESSIVRKKLEQQESLLRGQETRLSQLISLLEQLELSLSTQQQQNQAQLLEKQARVREARQNLESLKQIYSLQDQQQKAQVRQAFIAVNSSKNDRDLVAIQLLGA
ncbi:biotin/lipoyl-binding protein, partial [Anaplasma marginale]|uniref:biotin/lipoyl-binding protein n=1 Tax=Anaplasma marginale TaxID=770 RepID=UPI0018E97708